MKKGAAFCILLAGILWGTMGLFVRRYHACGLDAIDIVAVRAFTTTLCMTVFFVCYDRKLFRIKIKDIWCFLGTGLLSILFFNYCYFKTIQLTSMSVAAVLLYTAPAMVMILSRILFKENFTGIRLLSLVLTFVGCILVTGVIGDAQSLNAGGIMTGLGAGLGYALYSIFSRYALEKGYHAFTISFYTFLITSAGTLPLVSVVNILDVCTSNLPVALFSVAFGLVSTVLPYVLYTLGLRKTENGTASILASVEPVVATLLGVVCCNETITVGGLAGVVLILTAIVLCNLRKSSARKL